MSAPTRTSRWPWISALALSVALFASSDASAFTLALAGRVDPPGTEVMSAMVRLNQGEGYRYVDEHPGGWWSIALSQGDTAVFWPRGALIANVRGLDVPALEAFAMSPPPEQRILRLGAAQSLEPGSLWRRPFRHAGIKTVIFARFPAGLDLSGATVRVGGKP